MAVSMSPASDQMPRSAAQTVSEGSSGRRDVQTVCSHILPRMHSKLPGCEAGLI